MVKRKDYKYNNGYVITCPDKANDFINRKMFSKDNENIDKTYMLKNDFANWIPSIEDIPKLIISVKFFDSLEVLDNDFGKKIIDDALEKKLLLLMKIGDIPGVKPMKAGEKSDHFLYRAILQYTTNGHQNNKNLSHALQSLKRWSNQ